MSFLGIFLLVLYLLSAVLLIIIVLIQDDQGDGIGGLFGGGSSTAFGSRSGNILTRATTILGAVFLLTSFGMAFVSSNRGGADLMGTYRGQTEAVTNDWWNSDAPGMETEEKASSETETGN